MSPFSVTVVGGGEGVVGGVFSWTCKVFFSFAILDSLSWVSFRFAFTVSSESLLRLVSFWLETASLVALFRAAFRSLSSFSFLLIVRSALPVMFNVIVIVGKLCPKM